jgi:hypothetical protein
MKKIIWPLLLILVLTCALGAETTALKSARDLLDALQKGETVRMVTHYARCQLIADNEVAETVPDAIGGMTIAAFEYFAPGAVKNKKGFIAFSTSTLIEHRTHGHVLNYIKVRVYDDGAVQITAQYLKPTTYEIVMNEAFYATLGDGRTEKAGVSFFQAR